MKFLSPIVSKVSASVVAAGSAAYALLAAAPAYAVTISNNTALGVGGGSEKVTTNDTFQSAFIKLSQSAINTIIIIAGTLATGYLIYSGIQYITASGNPEKAKTARQGIINAIIGIVVVVSAFFIIRFATTIGNSASSAV